MQETIRRSISGIAYVVIILIGIHFSPILLFTIIGLISLYEILKLNAKPKQNTWIKYSFIIYMIFFFIITILPFTSFSTIDQSTFNIKWRYTYLFTIIWIFDSSAYLVGKQFGNNKIFPSISPKKSWEGFIGGYIFALITIILITYSSELINLTDNIHYIIFLTFFICFYATLGDFSASFIKRKFNLKDFGKFIPGHGGMMDRIDAFILIIPIINLLEYLNLYTEISFNLKMIL